MKMEFQSSIEALKKAMCLYPGVTIQSVGFPPGFIAVTARIVDTESIVWLQYFCYAANIGGGVYAEEKPVPGRETENTLSKLVWQFNFKNLPEEENSTPDLRIFGEWLIDNLVLLGRISSEERDELWRQLYDAH